MNLYGRTGGNFANEQLLWTDRFILDIRRAVLPDVCDYKFHLDLWQHLTSIATHHEVKLWSPHHFGLIDNYFKVLASLG